MNPVEEFELCTVARKDIYTSCIKLRPVKKNKKIKVK